VDEFDAFVLGEVGVVLMLNVASGSSRTRRQAAIGVVDRAWTPAQPGMSLDLAPDGGSLEAAR
jgi:hypothetical protein